VKINSIRTRLTLSSIALVIVFNLLAAVILGNMALNNTKKMRDSSLAETGQLLLSLLATHADDAGELLVALPPHREKVIWQAFRREGSFLARSHEAPHQALIVTNQNDFFATAKIGEDFWRVYIVTDAVTQIQLQIATLIETGVNRRTLLGFLLPGFISCLILSFSLPYAIQRGLLPLKKFSAHLDQGTGKRLDLLPEISLPEELRPVHKALNQALSRLHTLVQREKLFAAHASHELRTPLAGIRAQTQLIMLDSQGATQDSAKQVLQAIDRMEILLERLLLLARADLTQVELQPTAVHEVLMEEINRARNLYPRIKFNIMHSESICLPSDPYLLAMLIRNLLDNAAKHSQGDGVNLRLEKDHLSIQDNGRGLNAKLLAQQPEPFMRGDTDQEGFGLGLALTFRIAQALGIKLELNNLESGGLKVQLKWSNGRQSSLGTTLPTT